MIKLKQLNKSNNLKSSQNKVAIEKLEELSDIINENITDLVESGKSKYGWLDFSDTTNKLDTMLTELKGGNDMEEKERLTKYSEINKDYITPYCDNFRCNGYCRDCDYEQLIINKLAEYENTNLSPKEVEQLKKENKDLKSSQNKVAIEKLEELFDILNENITDFTDVGKSKYCWLCIEEFNKNFNSIIAELKG